MVFQAAVVDKAASGVCLRHVLSLSLSIDGGKPRTEHKNASLCVYVCVSTGVRFVSTGAHVHKRDRRGRRSKEKLNVLKLIPSVSCCQG